MRRVQHSRRGLTCARTASGLHAGMSLSCRSCRSASLRAQYAQGREGVCLVNRQAMLHPEHISALPMWSVPELHGYSRGPLPHKQHHAHVVVTPTRVIVRVKAPPGARFKVDLVLQQPCVVVGRQVVAAVQGSTGWLGLGVEELVGWLALIKTHEWTVLWPSKDRSQRRACADEMRGKGLRGSHIDERPLAGGPGWGLLRTGWLPPHMAHATAMQPLLFHCGHAPCVCESAVLVPQDALHAEDTHSGPGPASQKAVAATAQTSM